MLSYKILRTGTYNVDRGNPTVIHVNEGPPSESDDEGESSAPQGPSPEVIAQDIIGAARRQAMQMIDDAHIQAAMHIETAKKEAQQQANELYETTRTEAYDTAVAQATQEGDALRAQARQVLEDAEAQRQAMLAQVEPDMVELLISITAKLLDNAVQLHPNLVLALVRMGIHNATITGEVVVYVSAQDFEEVNKHKDQIMALTDGSVQLSIVKDLSLNPTDCIIETPFGNIDCSLGQQFEALRNNLTHLLGNKENR